MELGSNTILITGGATGIGFALAERFVAAGSSVIVAGRREEALAEAKKKVPALATLRGDVATEGDRVALVERALREFPKINVLVNNAGIQRRKRASEDDAPWSERASEIAINLEAPIHLTSLMLTHLRAQAKPAVINVTSGLAFVPGVFAPIYCATKAALHSFTVTLRYDLARGDRPIEVVEIVPPAVNTDLGGAGVHTEGAPLDAFADAVMKDVAAGKLEIGFGFSEKARLASREELDAISKRMAGA